MSVLFFTAITAAAPRSAPWPWQTSWWRCGRKPRRPDRLVHGMAGVGRVVNWTCSSGGHLDHVPRSAIHGSGRSVGALELRWQRRLCSLSDFHLLHGHPLIQPFPTPSDPHALSETEEVRVQAVCSYSGSVCINYTKEARLRNFLGRSVGVLPKIFRQIKS